MVQERDGAFVRRHALTLRAICARQGRHQSSVSGLYDIYASLSLTMQLVLDDSLRNTIQDLKMLLNKFSTNHTTDHLLADIIDERAKAIDNSFETYWTRLNDSMQKYLKECLSSEKWQEIYDRGGFPRSISRLTGLIEILSGAGSKTNEYFEMTAQKTYTEVFIEPLVSFFKG